MDLQIVGLDRLKAKCTPALYEGALKDILTSAAMLAEREARQGAPKDTSALARSITSDVQPTSARVFTTLAYAQVVEEGRRAGARMPPPDALLGWIRRHGIGAGLSDRQTRGLAFVIARAIGRRGVAGRFFFRNARDKVERALPGFIRAAEAAIEAKWHA